jgi:hypothetical protein
LTSDLPVHCHCSLTCSWFTVDIGSQPFLVSRIRVGQTSVQDLALQIRDPSNRIRLHFDAAFVTAGCGVHGMSACGCIWLIMCSASLSHDGASSLSIRDLAPRTLTSISIPYTGGLHNSTLKVCGNPRSLKVQLNVSIQYRLSQKRAFGCETIQTCLII